ncbi:MAG: hypothetical protein K0S82_1177 [Gaiellaceae bacterium]|jgi:hypothetical protein|nr:hypothetical protein [Gaiellaceae bacterium]
MSSQPVAADHDVDRTRSTPRVRPLTPTETKPSFLTTEFYAMIAGIVGVLIAAQQADNLDAPLAWTLAAAIAIGYILSRGIAKAGSAYRDHDHDH